MKNNYRKKLDELGYSMCLYYDKFLKYYKMPHSEYPIIVVTTKMFAKIMDIYPEVTCHNMDDVEFFMKTYELCEKHKKELGL